MCRGLLSVTLQRTRPRLPSLLLRTVAGVHAGIPSMRYTYYGYMSFYGPIYYSCPNAYDGCTYCKMAIPNPNLNPARRVAWRGVRSSS